MHIGHGLWLQNQRPPGAAFAPISLFAGGYTGNLLDFVTPAGLYSDAGVTLAGMGAQVHSIREQVGGGLISQTVSSFRGVRETTGVRLDGFDDYYPLSWAPASEAGAWSMAITADLPATAPADFAIVASTRAGTARFALFLLSSNSGLYLSHGAVQTLLGFSLLGTRVSIVLVSAAGGTLRAYVNGTLAATVTPTALSALPVAIGATGGGAANWGAIRARGYLHINRALTDDERAKLATYWS